jgi:hypothetical protein
MIRGRSSFHKVEMSCVPLSAVISTQTHGHATPPAIHVLSSNKASVHGRDLKLGQFKIDIFSIKVISCPISGKLQKAFLRETGNLTMLPYTRNSSTPASSI